MLAQALYRQLLLVSLSDCWYVLSDELSQFFSELVTTFESSNETKVIVTFSEVHDH